MDTYFRCYAEVSLEAIGRNIDAARARIPEGCRLLAVVKADAYGHGAVRVAKFLEDRVDFFAVATIEEAEELLDAGIALPVMILGYTSPRQFERLVKRGIRPAIYREEDAKALSEEAVRQGKTAKLHIAVDTGMTRIGFQVSEEDADAIARISRLPGIRIEGLFSHLSCADMTDKSFCALQFGGFADMIRMLKDRNVFPEICHICNSAGIMEFTDQRYDMVRSGITTYGIYPSEEVKKENMPLEPALSWRTHVVHVKEVGPGRGVSYGATFVTDRPVTRIATLSVGYADGYPRALSSKGRVLIHGMSAPILGRVCMDQMMVDVTDIPDVEVEDTATLVGRDGDAFIPIEEVADPAGRFNYEMLCDISSRVARIYDTDRKDGGISGF